MAKEYADRDVAFAFVYTREAHPSDRYPAHDRLERKLEHAGEMKRLLSMERPMLVDDLEGTVHHAYGRLPNMSYVLKPGGTIVYKANWTDPRTIRLALEQIFFERAERRTRRRTTPYYVEWQPHRPNDDLAFVEGLLEVGERAVEEYLAAVAHSEGEAAARPLQKWWSEKKRW